MTVRADEKPRGIDWIDLVHSMNYVEEKYGGCPEIHVSTDEDNKRDALLCITCPRGCKFHRNAIGVAFTSRKVPYSRLHKVCEVLHDMLLDLIEELDGTCPACLEVLYAMN